MKARCKISFHEADFKLKEWNTAQLVEVFADLEIITDQNEIEKIWEENPDVKTLMKSKEYYYLAYVKGNGVRLRSTPSTSGVINGLLYETRKDWVLLNDNYSLNEN